MRIQGELIPQKVPVHEDLVASMWPTLPMGGLTSRKRRSGAVAGDQLILA